MNVALALLIVIAATAASFSAGRYARSSPLSVSRLAIINTQAKYQLLLLGVAALVVAALFAARRTPFTTFFAPGHRSAPAAAVAWMGIAEGDSWRNVGASLTFFITLATLALTYAQFRTTRADLAALRPLVPWIMLFALSNAFSEEIIYRLGVVVPLVGSIDARYILLLSAIAFGLPHLRGIPNGIIGATMAGVLGWLLAKSVVETRGIFWAWTIHFVQDVVIFSALLLDARHSVTGLGALASGTPSSE